MNVGFDLDGIFVDKPPLVPNKIIEMLYRKTTTKDKLGYRIPLFFEQKIRIISHHYVLRPPLLKNIEFITILLKQKEHKLYLISSRFGFLNKVTEKILQRYKLDNKFHSMSFNLDNNQPHIFKNKKIKELRINKFIDDDLPLLKFLAKKNKNTTFYWLNKKDDKILKENLIAITKLENIL